MAIPYTRVRKDIDKLYLHHNELVLYIFLRNQAAYYPCRLDKNTVVPPGWLATSHEFLANNTGLSLSQVRTALRNLESLGFIIRLRKPDCTLISTVSDIDSRVSGNVSLQNNNENAKDGSSNKLKNKENKTNNYSVNGERYSFLQTDNKYYYPSE